MNDYRASIEELLCGLAPDSLESPHVVAQYIAGGSAASIPVTAYHIARTTGASITMDVLATPDRKTGRPAKTERNARVRLVVEYWTARGFDTNAIHRCIAAGKPGFGMEAIRKASAAGKKVPGLFP